MVPDLMNHTTKSGTVCGTLLTIIANLQQTDLVKTAILATVGAIVSFCVSLLLKFARQKILNYFKRASH
jgi:mannitol-specific phosphotransferase system IIBC component